MTVTSKLYKMVMVHPDDIERLPVLKRTPGDMLQPRGVTVIDLDTDLEARKKWIRRILDAQTNIFTEQHLKAYPMKDVKT